MTDTGEFLPHPPDWTNGPVWKLRGFNLPSDNKFPGEGRKWHEYGMVAGAEKYIVKPTPEGAGSFSCVYRAYDPKMDRQLAVKVIDPTRTNNHAAAGIDVQDEAVLMARAEHPNVVRVYDFFYQNLPIEIVGEEFKNLEFPVVVMEWVEAPNLKTLLRLSPNGLGKEKVIKIAEEIASAVDFMAQHKVIHRDLKPSNIFLTGKGVKISDFGLATGSCSGDSGDYIVGSPPYFSPEVCQGKPVTLRSEVYSLGVLCYQMLCGSLPFSKNTFPELIADTIFHRHKPLAEQEGALKKFDKTTLLRLDGVFNKALAKSPDGRFTYAIELANALKSCLEATNKPVSKG